MNNRSLLCKLGLHRWRIIELTYGQHTDRCSRCGKRVVKEG